MESKTPSPSEPGSQPPRKAYQKPRLHVYGDLTELTLGMLGMAADDGSGHPNMHFTS